MFKEMAKFLKHTGRKRQFLILLFLRCPFDAAMTIIYAVFLQNAFNSVMNEDKSRLTYVCILFTAVCFILFLYNGTIRSFYAPFVVHMEGITRRLLLKKISSFPYEKIEKNPYGDWLTRMNIDVQMPFSRPIHFPHAVCSIVNIAVSGIILWSMNPMIFGLVILFVAPHIAVSQFYIAKAMPALNKKSLEVAAVNTGDFSAIINCSQTAILYDGQNFLMENFKKSSMGLLKANMKMRRRSALNAGILPLFSIGYIVILAMGADWIALGSITFGDLTAAFQYRGGVLIGSMMLINCMVSIQASMAGIKRLNETLSSGETE